MINKAKAAVSLTWRLLFVLSYPLAITMHSAQAKDVPVVTDALDQIAQTHSTSLIIGACIAFLMMGAVIGALFPTPDDLRSTEINAWLRLLICLAGGAAAFLWVLHNDGALNLLTPIWVGGVAFVAPHLIQLVPSLVKAKLGLGSKTS